jgi:hypothetical protein
MARLSGRLSTHASSHKTRKHFISFITLKTTESFGKCLKQPIYAPFNVDTRRTAVLYQSIPVAHKHGSWRINLVLLAPTAITQLIFQLKQATVCDLLRNLLLPATSYSFISSEEGILNVMPFKRIQNRMTDL